MRPARTDPRAEKARSAVAVVRFHGAEHAEVAGDVGGGFAGVDELAGLLESC